MTQMSEPTQASAETASDLSTGIQRILAASSEPMTPSKVRSRLPAPLRNVSEQELTAALARQAAASVIYQFPKYRSQQDRFWDRSMPVHVAQLLRHTLADGSLTWTELRRKLPAYAVGQAESVLREQISQGSLFRHPPLSKRSGERYGLQPADPKEYLRQELPPVFEKLEQMGFQESQIRSSALELLHDEEWSPRMPEETLAEHPLSGAEGSTPQPRVESGQGETP